MEKIDTDFFGKSAPDVIVECTEKLNEIVDWINEQEKRRHDRQIKMTEV